MSVLDPSLPVHHRTVFPVPVLRYVVLLVDLVVEGRTLYQVYAVGQEERHDVTHPDLCIVGDSERLSESSDRPHLVGTLPWTFTQGRLPED